jgi:hypothetical protein
MPTYDVAIRMTVVKTYHIEAEGEFAAYTEAHKMCSVLLEDDLQEDHEEETLGVELLDVVLSPEHREPITESEALELSRQLWDRISKLPDADLDGQRRYQIERRAKTQCLEAMGYTYDEVEHGCFACQFTLKENTTGSGEVDCRKCPVPPWQAIARDGFDEDEDDRPCTQKGPYSDFVDAFTPAERRAAAIAVRDLMKETD